MFKEFSALAGLMGKLPKIQEESAKFQQRMGEITAEGDAGGGMVRAKVNGQFRLLSLQVSDDAYANPDRELLEDLIVAAVNHAVEKARRQLAEEAQKMAAELGLPPGLQLPGMT